jgi:hypothetical protein
MFFQLLGDMLKVTIYYFFTFFARLFEHMIYKMR